MSTISIKGLNKVALLKELYINAWQSPMYFGSPPTPEDFVERIEKCRNDQYFCIEYFFGRAIKVDLDEDDVDPWLYDRDAGTGAFQKCVETVKKNLS